MPRADLDHGQASLNVTRRDGRLGKKIQRAILKLIKAGDDFSYRVMVTSQVVV
jgi:hypothetical protein